MMRAFFLSSAPIHRKTITRVEGVVALGGTMAVAGFARENFKDTQAQSYPVASLGAVRNGDLIGRAVASPLHFWRALRAGRAAAGCDTIWVNSLDMLLLGLAVRPFLRGRQRVVYDVADLTPKQLSPGMLGRVLRWVERQACRQVDALVLTSPWFWWEYYRDLAPGVLPLLLENKVSPPLPERVPSPAAPPWRVVWHGQLRCRTSLRLALDLAKALPDAVEVHAWGAALAHLEEDFARAAAKAPNFVRHGSYSDAAIGPVFAGAHFVFAFDVDDGRNSALLLSNRLYHGVARALPVLAIAGTAVGKVVEAHKLGRTFGADSAEPLVAFFRALTDETYAGMRSEISEAQRAAAIYDTDFADLVGAIESGARARALPASEQIAVVLAPPSPAPAMSRTGGTSSDAPLHTP